MDVSYSIWTLLIIFGCTNALVFLHVGAMFREMMTGVDDRIWKINIAWYQNNIEARAEMMRKPWWRFRTLFLGRMVHCHACLGFWIGAAAGYPYGTFSVEAVGESLALGYLASGFNFIVWTILRKLGAEEL